MSTDGIDILKKRVKRLPARPGVYRMLNDAGDVLYVGKAKNLKNRVASYTQPERMGNRIRRMVFEARDLAVVETETEAEALLLEINLIKSLKPKYNIMFRDDTSYPYILISHEETPRVLYHRGAKKIKGDYFGPYPAAGYVHQTLELMERAFRLRTCSPSVFKNRTRPCLKFDIKRCSAPCVNKISEKGYAELISQARDFLKGKGTAVQKALQVQMQKAAEVENYEGAAVYRDRLQALARVTQNSTALTEALKDGDVFGLALNGGKACVQGFFYRGGQHVGNQSFFPKGVEEMVPEQVMQQFLALHYENRQIPRHIVCEPAPSDLETLQEALSMTSGHKVEISSPKRGEKRKATQQAVRNAEQNLKRKVAEGKGWQQQMQAFAEVLGIEKCERVECYDISNISGKNAVASMVVAGDEGMLKSDYRKFAIKSKDTPDDYAMMRETLLRRYGKLAKEENAIWPDVVMVDGGKGHLTTLVKAFEDLELTGQTTLCAIAKGEERDKGLETIFLAGADEPLPVPHNTPLIFLLQRIRDEAHRFAIGFHRQKRAKGIEKSVLDEIPGIGPKRKKALLLQFGSAESVKAASVDDMSKVEGISKELATHIYEWLHA